LDRTAVIHYHSLFCVCADLFVAVSETSYGIRVGFVGSTHIVFTIYLFICIGDVKSTFIQLRKQKSYSHNRK